MADLYLEDLAELVKAAQQEARRSDKRELRTILFCDLCDSTGIKVDEGHESGSAMTRLHNSLCEKIVGRHDGRMFKELGDGALCEFLDPLKACLASLNFKKACSGTSPLLHTKAALTLGMVEIHADGDLIGSTVDRCARIQALAQPNQILVDKGINDAVQSMLADYPEFLVSKPARAELRGWGTTEIMEITTRGLGFAVDTDHFGGEISPVLAGTYPSFTEPSEHLICDGCGQPVAPDGKEAVVSVEEVDGGLALRIFHKKDCDKSPQEGKTDLGDLTNPVEYVRFVSQLFERLQAKGGKVRDAKGISRVLFGMYRQVFRPTTPREQADFELGYALRQAGL